MEGKIDVQKKKEKKKEFSGGHCYFAALGNRHSSKHWQADVYNFSESDHFAY